MVMRDSRASEEMLSKGLASGLKRVSKLEEQSRLVLDPADLSEDDLERAGLSALRWFQVTFRNLNSAYTLGVEVAELHRRAVRSADDVAEAMRRIARMHESDPSWLPHYREADPGQLGPWPVFVDLLSWAVCLGEADMARQLLGVPVVAGADDAVVDELAVLTGVRASRTVDAALHPKHWDGWLAVVAAAPEGRPEQLAAYVAGWLGPWVKHEGAVEPGAPGFLGHWSYDAAALAVAYEIDDTACREVPEYPADLVDYARSLRAG